jgi:hypothetical protein
MVPQGNGDHLEAQDLDGGILLKCVTGKEFVGI